MKILIDIGHPAHVHYFRNMIQEMQKEGHEFMIIAKDKDITHELLEKYNIPYESRGKTGSTNSSKLLKFPKIYAQVLRAALKFKPDVMLGISGIFIAPVGYLLGIPSIVLDDTEQAKKAHKIYKPFAKKIITPDFFQIDFGKKHLKMNSIFELFYMHPNNFTPNPKVLESLNLNEQDKFVIFRLINFTANHDKKDDNTTSVEEILEFQDKLSQRNVKLFISAEGELDDRLKPYELTIDKRNLHDLLSYAQLYVGQGGTTGTEASLLGTYSFIINPQAKNATIRHILKDNYDIQDFYDNFELARPKIFELLDDPNLKENMKVKSSKYINSKENPTEYLIDFFKNKKYLS